MMLSPFPKASLFHFQGASKRTERDQLSDDRQYQIKQRTKLELDMKDLKDIVDDDSSVKVSPANCGDGHLWSWLVCDFKANYYYCIQTLGRVPPLTL